MYAGANQGLSSHETIINAVVIVYQRFAYVLTFAILTALLTAGVIVAGSGFMYIFRNDIIGALGQVIGVEDLFEDTGFQLTVIGISIYLFLVAAATFLKYFFAVLFGSAFAYVLIGKTSSVGPTSDGGKQEPATQAGLHPQK